MHFLVLLRKFKYPFNERMWNILRNSYISLFVVNWKQIILFCISLSTVLNTNYRQYDGIHLN